MSLSAKIKLKVDLQNIIRNMNHKEKIKVGTKFFYSAITITAIYFSSIASAEASEYQNDQELQTHQETCRKLSLYLRADAGYTAVINKFNSNIYGKRLNSSVFGTTGIGYRINNKFNRNVLLLLINLQDRKNRYFLGVKKSYVLQFLV